MKTNCCVCSKEFKTKPSRVKRTKGLSCCSLKCRGQYLKTYYLNDNNPNRKYNYDRSLFKNIDSEHKAYLLGWIASDGHVRKDSIIIKIHDKDQLIIDQLSAHFNFPKRFRKDRVILTIPSKVCIEDVCKLLNIKPGKKSHNVNFPHTLSEEMKIHFIRGFFDGDGYVSLIDEKHTSPRCGIATNSANMRKGILDFINIPAWTDNKEKLEWSGNNCLDFLNKLYASATIKLQRKYDRYEDIASWVPSVSYSYYFKHNEFKFSKSRKDAVSPFKTRASDSGYDLTILDKIKTTGEVEYYDTGIKIRPGYGYYFELVARSSLTKTGYILANAVGIIDRTYVGNIIVPLIKLDKTAKDLELPGRYVQIIPKQIVHFDLVEVDSFDETQRNSSGFGSTGV